MFKILVISLSLAVLFISCMEDTVGSNDDFGDVKLQINIEKIGEMRGINDRVINLNQLIVRLSSNAGDEFTDTIGITGNSSNIVLLNYDSLRSGINWTISATTIDQVGMVIHSNSTDFTVVPNQTISVPLYLQSMYTMIETDFYPIKDSVNRVEVIIDSLSRVDSLFTAQSFLGDTVTLNYDYLPADGNYHQIRLNAYGQYNGENRILYSGDTTLIVQPGVDYNINITLFWMLGDSIISDTSFGNANMSVTIGTIGTMNVNGELIDEAEDSTNSGITVTNIYSSYAQNLKVSGQYAGWISNNNIFRYDGNSVINLGVSTNSFQIYNSKIAWVQHDGIDNEIYYFDGIQTIQITNNDVNDELVSVSDSIVCWYSHDGNDNEIFIYQNDTTLQITDNNVNDYLKIAFNDEVIWYCDSAFVDTVYPDTIYEGDTIHIDSINIIHSSGMFSYKNGVYKKLPGYNTYTFHVSDNNLYWINGMNIIKYDGINIDTIISPNFYIDNMKVMSEYITYSNYQNLYLFNGDSSSLIYNYSMSMPGSEYSMHYEKLAFSESDGNDYEIYYFDGYNTTRLTSNNVSDYYPIAISSGVIWNNYENGSWVYYYDGVNMINTSIEAYQNGLSYGNGALIINTYGVNLLSFN